MNRKSFKIGNFSILPKNKYGYSVYTENTKDGLKAEILKINRRVLERGPKDRINYWYEFVFQKSLENSKSKSIPLDLFRIMMMLIYKDNEILLQKTELEKIENHSKEFNNLSISESTSSIKILNRIYRYEIKDNSNDKICFQYDFEDKGNITIASFSLEPIYYYQIQKMLDLIAKDIEKYSEFASLV